MDLPVRSEIKNMARDRLDISESPMEYELNHHLLRIGMRGKKQHPVGKFFIDIAFPKAKVAVEYDGAHHDTTRGYDAARDRYLEEVGWKVIHVNRFDVLSAVAAQIRREVIVRDKKMLLKYVANKIVSFDKLDAKLPYKDDVESDELPF